MKLCLATYSNLEHTSDRFDSDDDTWSTEQIQMVTSHYTRTSCTQVAYYKEEMRSAKKMQEVSFHQALEL